MRRLMLLTGTLLLIFAVGETVYRVRASSKRQEYLAGRDPDTLITEAAPAPLYYRLKPDYPGFTNSHGYRDLERRVFKVQGVYRIAVVGDSVSMQGALPFEQLYVRQLQRKLDSEFPGRTEVLNFGITGYNTSQEAALLEREVLPYAPDLVVWQFHDNDGQHTIYGGGFANYFHRPTSYFANYVANKLDHFFCGIKAGRSSRGTLTSDQGNLVCRWNQIVGHLRDVAALLNARGIGMLVILYPTWPDGDDWANYGEAGHELHRELVAELESLGVEVVDLLRVFERVDPAAYRVEPTDPWHPNAEGHELIADSLFSSLRPRVR